MASEARPAGRRPRVAMLLHKPVWNDSRVRRAAGALAGAGHDVTVIHLPRGEHPRTGRGQLDGCRVVPALPPALARRRLPLQGHRALLMAAFVRAVVRERPDVVHAHDAAMLLPGAVGARLVGARLVYDSHELATGVPYREPHWARFVAALERAIVPRCAGVVTVSDGIARRLQELYRLPVRPTVVRNIPDVDVDMAPDALPGPLRARLGLRAQQPLVLHQGALAPRRGCEAAVAAIGRLPSAHLVFLGDPWPGYAGEVERLADRMGARGRIHFLPSVPVERLVEHTADADVGLSLLDGDCDNHRLALPNKVFEYVAAGVPVVVSDLPELRALVDRYGIGRCCDPSDATGLAAAVAGVLATGDRLVSSVEAAARELTWAAERQRLTRMYDGLREAPSHRGRPPARRAMVVVRNGCTHDARVLREADTLRRLGLDPLVVGAVTASDRAPAETLDGIPVRRLRPGGAPTWLRGLRRGRPASGAPDGMETVASPGAPQGVETMASPAPPPRSRGGALRRGGAVRRLAVTADWYRRGTRRVLAERPALVHCNDYNTMWIGIAAKLLCRSRLVYDSHELWPDRNLRPEWRPWLLACEWLFVRVADVVLTTSPAYAERIAARYGVPAPVVVRNVPSRATPSADGASAGSAPSRNGRLAAYFGAVTSGRGLEAAVAALAEVEDLELRIVGPDSRGYGARLAALARELGVERRLELLPPVRPAEAGRALAGADVGLALIEPVCRSYELTLPNKLFEYMEAGLPVLATDLPAMSALLAETGAGVSVRAGDSGAVAAGLRAALEPRRNAELRAAARDAARRLTWDRERQILIQAYDGAMAGTR